MNQTKENYNLREKLNDSSSNTHLLSQSQPLENTDVLSDIEKGEQVPEQRSDELSVSSEHSISRESQSQEEQKCIQKSRLQFLFRLVVVVFAIGGIAAASFTPGILPKDPVECVEDQLFMQTRSINDYLAAHDKLKHAFMIVCGLMMDITVIGAFISFVVKGRTWRFPLILVTFYFLRFIVQKTFLMRFPEGYLWENPGFPSITVPYGKTNDFFYSGHVGGAIIMMLEYRSLAKEYVNNRTFFRGMQVFAIVTTIFQAFLMIFLRGHYTIDLFAGAIAGHYLYIVISGWAPYLDTLVCRIDKEKRSRTISMSSDNSERRLNSSFSHDVYSSLNDSKESIPAADRSFRKFSLAHIH